MLWCVIILSPTHQLALYLCLFSVRLGLNLENPKEFTLDTYKEHFENEFLIATEIYYTIESSAYIPANGICEYMKRVNLIIINNFCAL